MIKKMILGLGVMALLSACGMMSAPLPEQPTAIPTLTPASSTLEDPARGQVPPLGGAQSGDLLVWIFSDPATPVRGENTFEAFITDENGTPVTDATISFDINMTNMNHRKNVVTATSLGDGYYSGIVHFLMPGPWRVIVGIERPVETTTVRFDFMVDW
jgi:hypothetical protein